MHTGSKFKVTRFSFQIKIEDSYNGERNFKFYPRLYVRSFFLLKPVKTCSRLFVAFRLVHLENAINPPSTNIYDSIVNFGETISTLSLSRNFIRCKIIRASVSRPIL